MKQFKFYNNLIGWIVFLIAIVTYTLTLEPTASFWDCGEFISAAYRLQVVHPPGAPLFLLIGRFFSMFAFGDASLVAFWVNFLSGLASALTVLFVFWTTTHLAKKILLGSSKNEGTDLNKNQLLLVMASGLVAGLSLTFSDTFWFSAVEAEVYALSSFFTAFIFWCILKWENATDHDKHADRWLILIGYLQGLAIGVHLLSLLVIPAIVFVYYFKKYKVTRIGVIKAALVSVACLGVVQFGVIPGLPSLAAKFDLLFVNNMGMPFGTGVLVFSGLFIGTLVYAILFSIRKKRVLMNTFLMIFTFILIGYSSYATVVIRSLANPPLDMNNPEHPFSLLSYLNREQYGDRPLYKGQYFNAQVVGFEEGALQYIKDGDKYVSIGPKETPVYDQSYTTIFPRMWSNRGDHVAAYRSWEGLKEGQKATSKHNLDFLFSYQMNWMYMRYFFWNVVGRQNHNQGHGGVTKGNWISGIGFLDKARLGPQENLPEGIKDNKGRNTYYFLPLILGVLGLVYHYKKNNKDALVITMLFLFTGILIVIYLNFPPRQPRERDYAYVGSYQTFMIWIGLGVLFVADWLSKWLNFRNAAIIASVFGLLASPMLMATNNWDDHDRSGRSTALDFATSYLESCAPNAILFTNGDNDTYPLWYAQNVEGIRTDIRVINLSLLNTDWYANGLKKKAYDSEPVPFSMTPDMYISGTRDFIRYAGDKFKYASKTVNLKEVINYMTDENAKATAGDGSRQNVLPTKKFYIPVDKKQVLANGTVAPEDADKVVNAVTFGLGDKKTYIQKNELIVLDFLATNNWERPVYFAITTGADSYLNLMPYFQLDGLTYRVVPIKSEVPTNRGGEYGRINTNIMYDNLMNKFKWGNMNKDGVFLDETILRQTKNLRNICYRLAKALIEENKKDSAIAVLDRAFEVMPDKNVPYDVFALRLAEAYYNAGEFEKPQPVIERLLERYGDNFKYYKTFDRTKFARQVENEMGEAADILYYSERLTRTYGQKELNEKIRQRINILSGNAIPDPAPEGGPPELDTSSAIKPGDTQAVEIK